METLTITRVYNDKVETKYGVRDKTAIYTQEHPDVKMSTFDKAAMGIKVGDTIQAQVTKNGSFTNFKMGGATPPRPQNNLEGRVAALESAVFGGKEAAKSVDQEAYNDDTF